MKFPIPPLSMWQQQLKRQISFQSKVVGEQEDMLKHNGREYKNGKDI